MRYLLEDLLDFWDNYQREAAGGGRWSLSGTLELLS